MKANELRIGNLFIEKYSQSIIEVIELSKDKIIFSGNFTSDWQAEEIKLTEDFLIRNTTFDLTRMTCLNRYCFDNFFLYGNESEIYTRINGKKIIIDSVHKLQNVFYYCNEIELKFINIDNQQLTNN